MSTEVMLPIEAEKVNRETGELVPFAAAAPAEFHGHVGAGTLSLDERQRTTLMDPLPDEDHSILPTGEVYVSQVHVRRKLNEVFGPGGWALVPRGPFTMEGQTVCREYALIAGGRFISEAIGESDYQPNNQRMSYASACEAAKSNALTRCCKDLGVASECWDKRFCERFQAQFCVKVWREKQKRRNGELGEFQWRRKDAEPFWDEAKRGGGARQDERQAGDEDEQFDEGEAPATTSRAARPAQASRAASEKSPACPECHSAAKVIKSRFPKEGKVWYCLTDKTSFGDEEAE